MSEIEQIVEGSRYSLDGGTTWSDLKFYDDLQRLHPVLAYAGEVMICAGRDMREWRPAFSVSPDDGETWSDRIPLLPERSSGGGYTAIGYSQKPGRVLIVTSTSGQSYTS